MNRFFSLRSSAVCCPRDGVVLLSKRRDSRAIASRTLCEMQRRLECRPQESICLGSAKCRRHDGPSHTSRFERISIPIRRARRVWVRIAGHGGIARANNWINPHTYWPPDFSARTKNRGTGRRENRGEPTVSQLVASQSPLELSRCGPRLLSDEQLYRVHGNAIPQF